MSARLKFAWSKSLHDMFWFDMFAMLLLAFYLTEPAVNPTTAGARAFFCAIVVYFHLYSFWEFYQQYVLTTLSLKGEWRELEIGDRQAFIRQAVANGTRDINSINHPDRIKSFRRLALLFEDDVVAAVTYFGVEESEIAVAAVMRRILKNQHTRLGGRSYSDYYVDSAKCGFIFASGNYFAPIRCPASGLSDKEPTAIK